MALLKALLNKSGKPTGIASGDNMEIPTGADIRIADAAGLQINSIALNAESATLESNGAALVGISGFDHLVNAASATNVAEALDALDTAISNTAGTMAATMAASDAANDLVMDLSTAATDTTLVLKGAQTKAGGTLEELWRLVDSASAEIWSIEKTAALTYEATLDAGKIKLTSDGTNGTMTTAAAMTLTSGGATTVTSTSGTLLLDATGQTMDMNMAALDLDASAASNINVTGASLTIQTTGSGDVVLNPAGDIDASLNKIVNLATPTAGNDAANKSYVDGAIAGLKPKQNARLATAADLGTVTYDNGTAGVGATITNAGTQVALSVDGTATVAGDIVLVKDQASALQNGLYEVTDIGSGSTNWVLTRTTDWDGSPTNELTGGEYTLVYEGATNLNKGFRLSTDYSTVGDADGVCDVGTEAQDFSQFYVVEPITASTGLTRSANDIQLANAATSSGINVTSGAITAVLASAGGLKFVSNEFAIEPADFAGTGLEDDGSDNLRIASSAAGNGLTGGSGSAIDVTINATSYGLASNTDDLELVLGSNSGLQQTTSDTDYGTGLTVKQNTITNVLVNATSTTTCSDRDVLVMNASGTIVPGDADDSFADQIVGIANGAHSADANATVFNVPGSVIGGFTGLTAGTLYFIDATTAGGLTSTAPSTPGQQIVRVGFAISTTELVYMPQFVAQA